MAQKSQDGFIYDDIDIRVKTASFMIDIDVRVFRGISPANTIRSLILVSYDTRIIDVSLMGSYSAMKDAINSQSFGRVSYPMEHSIVPISGDNYDSFSK